MSNYLKANSFIAKRPSAPAMITTLVTKLHRKISEKANLKAVKAVISNLGFWYIDIPRTSSTSLKLSLHNAIGFPFGKSSVFEKDFATNQYIGDHLTATELEDLLGTSLWKSLRKFTIVRNPYERVISLYGYQLRANHIHPSLSFPAYVACLYEMFHDQVKWDWFRYSKLWIPQVEYVSCATGCVDPTISIIRFEKREQDLKLFFDKIGLDIDLSINVQGSQKQILNNIDCDRASRKAIEEIYCRDFNEFDY